MSAYITELSDMVITIMLNLKRMVHLTEQNSASSTTELFSVFFSPEHRIKIRFANMKVFSK